MHPNFDTDQHDAALMKGMQVVVERLHKAREAKEVVVIFGDYDADGVPATALLVRACKKLNVQVFPVIPSRASGYGLTKDSLALILSHAPSLVITVDNGTVAVDEIASLADAGIDVIVIDHHEPHGEVANRALAIINPKQEDCPYPFTELCACALAWKVMGQWYLFEGEDVSSLKWELDLVALSTIADMVPLIGENRLLAVYGMRVLQKTRNKGLRALMASAGVDTSSVQAGDVGFKIAPRINAPSRMHQEEVLEGNSALELLVTEDAGKAAHYAEHLTRCNTERQQLVDDHLAEAERQMEKRKDDRVIIVYHESWSTGVIGLVASRLLERYRRPVIALAKEGNEIKGSVRSVDGVHALELLESGSSQMSRFGGHAKAAGLTLNGDVDTFRLALNDFIEAHGMTIEQLRLAAERIPDMELSLEEANLELADALEELEPFGVGFPKPLFQVNCWITDVRKVGNEGKHLSCFLTDKALKRKAIGFQKGGLSIEPTQMYDVRFTLEKETWREVTAPVCHIQAILSESSIDKI